MNNENNAAAVGPSGTRMPETKCQSCPSKNRCLCHVLSSLVVHDLFVYTLATTRSIQWIVFCLLQALVPIVSGVLLWLRSESPLSKLFARVYFSTATIFAIVYNSIGLLWIYDDRKKPMIVMAMIGLFSSLYHWYMVEKYCFRIEKTNGDTFNTSRESASAIQDAEVVEKFCFLDVNPDDCTKAKVEVVEISNKKETSSDDGNNAAVDVEAVDQRAIIESAAVLKDVVGKSIFGRGTNGLVDVVDGMIPQRPNA